MAKTLVSDVVIPSNFEDYIWERTAEVSAFLNSGIIVPVEGLDITDGGRTINMPFWQDLGSTEEDLSDSASLTPAKITSAEQIARIQYLGKAWSVNDLARWVAGSDPVQNLANLVGDFWARVLQARLIQACVGLFGAASMAGNVLDISGLVADAAVISGTTMADALNKMGMHKGKLTHIAMHSDTHTKLSKDGLIATERDKDNDYDFDSFGGRRVVVDDGLPEAAGVYDTYLFGQGAFGMGRGAVGSEAFESDRDILAGDVTATSRALVVLHPGGTKFTSASVAGAGPTRTELATAANWEAVFELANIPIVNFKHKLA